MLLQIYQNCAACFNFKCNYSFFVYKFILIVIIYFQGSYHVLAENSRDMFVASESELYGKYSLLFSLFHVGCIIDDYDSS